MFDALNLPPPAADRAAVASVVALLQARFGDRLSVAEAVRGQHVNAVTWHPPEAPDAVLFATCTDDVVEAVKLCAAHRVPLIPFGHRHLAGGAT